MGIHLHWGWGRHGSEEGIGDGEGLFLSLYMETVLWILSSGIFSATGRHCRTITTFLPSFPQTVLRIVVLGIWDYIENKIEVKTRGCPNPLPRHPGSGKCHCSMHSSMGTIKRLNSSLPLTTGVS